MLFSNWAAITAFSTLSLRSVVIFGFRGNNKINFNIGIIFFEVVDSTHDIISNEFIFIITTFCTQPRCSTCCLSFSAFSLSCRCSNYWVRVFLDRVDKMKWAYKYEYLVICFTDVKCFRPHACIQRFTLSVFDFCCCFSHSVILSIIVPGLANGRKHVPGDNLLGYLLSDVHK